MKNIQMEESEISVRVEVGAVRVSMYSCVGLPLCPVFVCGINEQGEKCTKKHVPPLCFLLLSHTDAAAGGSHRNTW